MSCEVGRADGDIMCLEFISLRLSCFESDESTFTAFFNVFTSCKSERVSFLESAQSSNQLHNVLFFIYWANYKRMNFIM